MQFVAKNTQTTTAGASVDHDAHAGLLDDLMAWVAPCFARRETRLTCRDMVHGLLAELEDYNCWTLAEAAGHPSPCRMQHLLSRARCDEQQMLDAAANWAASHLTAGRDQSDVVLIVDETADAKSSGDCAGAARQYSGTLGGIAMCQVAVTLTCASPAGHALIGRALYLPAEWAADEERRDLAGVPEEVMFATKPELAGRLLQHAHDRGIRAAFVAGDEVYGGLELRRSIRGHGTGYMLAVRSNHAATRHSQDGIKLSNDLSAMTESGPPDADYFSAADESDNPRGQAGHATGDADAGHSAATNGAAS